MPTNIKNNHLNKQEFVQLLDKYLDGTATTEEQALLFEYYQKEQTTNDWHEQELGHRDQVGNNIWSQLQAQINTQAPAPSIPLYRRTWLQAAAVLILVFAGAALWYNSNSHPAESSALATHKVAPAPIKMQQAVLTLSNGAIILLDTAADGVLATQGNTIIEKQGRKISYKPALQPIAKSSEAGMVNHIATGKGAQYQVVLPDGSNAWLNATSSISFAASNAQPVRKVEVEGEAYFEVAKNKHRPFRVAVLAPSKPYNHAVIEVLGTHFNVNTYIDEGLMRTTLLEGSLKVHTSEKDESGSLLVPGQQAQVLSADKVKVMPVDVSRVVAWQKGLFDFEGATIREVMRQLSRWYDVEITYEKDSKSKHFSGKLSRTMSLSDVLTILEQSGLRFKIQGKKLKVLS